MDYWELMNHTFMNQSTSSKFSSYKLLIVIFSACLSFMGCQSGSKTQVSLGGSESLSQPVSPTVFNAPSMRYLLLTEAAGDEQSNTWSAQQWADRATSLYQEKHYARALRAANIALTIDEELMPARQLALLANIKIMQNNIRTLHKNEAMSANDKADLKESLTMITSLIGTKKVALTD